MSRAAPGCGAYTLDSTYRYVGFGGDFDVVRRKKDFTCLITICTLPLVCLLLPAICWWRSQAAPFDCFKEVAEFQQAWSQEQKEYCCEASGVGCGAAQPATAIPASPPTPPPTPARPSDPYNCALSTPAQWRPQKRAWCCSVHHQGCDSTTLQSTAPPQTPPATSAPAAVNPIAEPYNCEDGHANWQNGWSITKKSWCCMHKGKGCTSEPGATTSEPYDCNAGYANWMMGWSVAKKAWCCSKKGRGCPLSGGGCTSDPNVQGCKASR